MEDLLRELGASDGAARSVHRELLERHAEAHRRYHTLEHLQEAQTEADRLLASEPEADRVAVHLAIWFHDAIYDATAGAGESEAASADLVVDRLPSLWAADRDRIAEEVARLVRLTAAHRVEPHDRTGAVLVDADLWVLSSSPERYDRYATDVRAEYAHVAGDA